MSLFNLFQEPQNILPYDGETIYYGKKFSDAQCKEFYDFLLNEISWKPDEAVIFGKLIETKRKVAWYGDSEFSYTYSGRTKTANLWLPKLLEIKNLVEEITAETYNSCLLNLYHDGSEGMAYHSDGEKDLKKNGAIASITFGAERKFVFKHKTTAEKVEIFLENGSILVMKGETQKNWLHRLPPTKKVNSPRVNLTFRTIIRD